MTRDASSLLDELEADLAAATGGEWRACREHEDFDGPMFDLDEDERAEFEARPFVRICAPDGCVTNNHDLFAFRPADARLIVDMKRALPTLIAAARMLERLNQGVMRAPFAYWPHSEMEEARALLDELKKR